MSVRDPHLSQISAASPPASDVPTIVLSRTRPLRGETQDSRL
jgi:hypothetical protein